MKKENIINIDVVYVGTTVRPSVAEFKYIVGQAKDCVGMDVVNIILIFFFNVCRKVIEPLNIILCVRLSGNLLPSVIGVVIVLHTTMTTQIVWEDNIGNCVHIVEKEIVMLTKSKRINYFNFLFYVCRLSTLRKS